MSRRRSARGFSVLELMIVVTVVGILSSFALPRFTRAAARAHRSEMFSVLEKMRMHFINYYRNNGHFPLAADGTSPAIGVPNPAGPSGIVIGWDPTAAGWQDYSFPPTGGLRMRYSYTSSGPTITVQAVGNFPGMNLIPSTNYSYIYTETYTGDAPPAVTEFPDFDGT
jgi:prepilin-type N-terminal cleavage/methylation domain-containing protein